MIDIQEVLLQKYRYENLGHFYILRAPKTERDPKNFLENWVKGFLANILAEEKNLTQAQAKKSLEMGHGDILILKKNKDEDYKLDDDELRPLFQFQAYKALQLKWRFCIVLDAHLITSRYSNKLLKTLEDPQEKTSLIFCQQYEKSFIPTIESRAITLTIPAKNDCRENKISPLEADYNTYLNNELLQNNLFTTKEKEKIIAFFKDEIGPRQLADTIKRDRTKQNELFRLILDLFSSQKGSFKEMDSLCKEIMWERNSSAFHNQYLERLFNLTTKGH